MKTKKTKAKAKKFKLSLDLAGEIFQAKANTFPEALNTIYKDSFGKVKTWGIFTLEIKGKKSQLEMRPLPIKRAFLGKFAQDLLLNRLTMMLK